MIFKTLRTFWRRNFTRRWVFDIVVHRVEIPPIYDEAISGNSTLCILNKKLFVTIDLNGYKPLTPYRRGLLEYAHGKCYSKRMDLTTYDKVLVDFILTE